MVRTVSNSDWNPIVSAPTGAELELCVHEGEEYHILAFPRRRNGVGWLDTRRTEWCQLDRHTGDYGIAAAREVAISDEDTARYRKILAKDPARPIAVRHNCLTRLRCTTHNRYSGSGGRALDHPQRAGAQRRTARRCNQ